MTSIVKYERLAIEGEVLPPETEREREYRDPSYFFAAACRITSEVYIANLMTGAGPISGEVVNATKPLHVRTWNPDPLMRRMGYTANPDTCRHFRKAYDPQSGWSCRDCGERNLAEKSRLTF